MKFISSLILLISSFQYSLCQYQDFPLFQRFLDWAFSQRINIEKDDPDLLDSIIYKNWLKNDAYINYINSKNLTYKLGHNKFSGYSIEEYRIINGFDNIENGGYKGIRKYYNVIESLTMLPSSVDWRKKGVVSPIQDQGQCGSCWAFSATASLESALALKTEQLTKMSEQQLVDCDNFKHGGSDFGCNGGLMQNAFTWIGKNDGLCSYSDYPYVSGITKKSGSCNLNCVPVSQSDVSKYMSVVENDEGMMTALSMQPVSVAIQADQMDFQLYKSGVFTGKCGTTLDHGVVLVGYGTDSETGLDYYILRNSWGTSWGQNGYMYIGRGIDPETNKPYNNGDGQCGVLLEGSYPVL